MIADIDWNILLPFLVGIFSLACGIWSLKTGQALVKGGLPQKKEDGPIYFWITILMWFGIAFLLFLVAFKQILQTHPN
jgi:hypothetical protein